MTTTEYGIVSDFTRGQDWYDEGNGNFTQLRRSAQAAWGNNAGTTTGLTYGYWGGTAWNGSAWTSVADGTTALTDNATNYVERTVAGVVSDNTSGFTASSLPMAVVVTASGAITSITDRRAHAVPSSGIAATIFDAKGDLLTASAADTPAILTVGSNGQRIKAASGESTGLQWVDEHYTVPFIIDGGGSVITTGLQGGLQVDVTGTIVAATQLALDGLTGSIVTDIWKDTYANHPPTVADTITASAKPTISSSTKSTDTTLTGWTTGITAGDILFYNVDSVSTFTRVLVSLKVRKT